MTANNLPQSVCTAPLPGLDVMTVEEAGSLTSLLKVLLSVRNLLVPTQSSVTQVRTKVYVVDREHPNIE